MVCLVLIAAILGGTATADGPPKSKSALRVLFVGHDPESPQIVSSSAIGRTRDLYEERTADFENFLRQRFRSVRVVYGEDYSVEMSDRADVTIFDCRPKALTPARNEVDKTTGETIYEPATYLPVSFDRPALMISAASPLIGEPLGLKLDWL